MQRKAHLLEGRLKPRDLSSEQLILRHELKPPTPQSNQVSPHFSLSPLCACLSKCESRPFHAVQFHRSANFVQDLQRRLMQSQLRLLRHSEFKITKPLLVGPTASRLDLNIIQNSLGDGGRLRIGKANVKSGRQSYIVCPYGHIIAIDRIRDAGLLLGPRN